MSDEKAKTLLAEGQVPPGNGEWIVWSADNLLQHQKLGDHMVVATPQVSPGQTQFAVLLGQDGRLEAWVNRAGWSGDGDGPVWAPLINTNLRDEEAMRELANLGKHT
jgi:hypothetical protein